MPAVVDLHAHFPMHLESVAEQAAMQSFFERIGDLDYAEEHFLIMLAGLLFGNWYHGKPRITLELLRQGGVDTVLSVLYPFFDEVAGVQATGGKDWQLTWPGPSSGYFADVLAQLEAVDEAAAAFEGGNGALVAHDFDELTLARQTGRIAIVHALEGGFALGATEAEIETNTRTLAASGVAYVTIAHLLYRHVAGNVPPLPRVALLRGSAADRWCHEHLPVPPVGLTALGKTLVRNLVRNGVLLDLTHLSEPAMTDTLDLLDELDHECVIPVLVSHGAYRFGTREYNLTEAQVRRIVRRGGVIGLLLCEDFMRDGLDVDGVVLVIRSHIAKLAAIIGDELRGADPFDYLGIGTDLDGFIQPLEGVNTAADLRALSDALLAEFGDGARKICSDNAYRLLESGKRYGRRIGSRMPWSPIPDSVG